MKVIIDTDPGHDDALAIMFAALSGGLDVLALTTVAGNSGITNVTRNARYVLRLIGREDIPIYSGAARPLRRELVKANVHGESGLAGIDPTNPARLTGDAPERIRGLVRANPNEVTLITLGPLTNVARAIRRDPRTMRLVKRIVSMGGAIAVPGNKNRVAEFNCFVDPEAADIAVRFPVEQTLVPLDPCNRVKLALDDFRAVADPRLHAALLSMIRPYISNTAEYEGVPAALMYDPLTIFYALRPEACSAERMHIIVETDGAATRGMTVVDRRKIPDGAEPNVRVVSRIPVGRFREDFFAALNALRRERRVVR